jgi:hemoglobin
MGRAILFNSFVAISFIFATIFSQSALAEDKKESLYTRLGGIYNIAITVDHLVDKLYTNHALNANPNIKNVHDQIQTKAGFKVWLTNWVAKRTGGPDVYKPDEFGRGKNMKDSHPHLKITDREFDIIMTECLQTFYNFNVPDQEISELMADLQSFRDDIVTNPTEGYKSPYQIQEKYRN